MKKYLIVVEPTQTGFSAYSPYLPGCIYNDGEVWCARGIGEDIFTQGQTVDELDRNIEEAVALHFDDEPSPSEINVLIVSELKLAHAPAATS